MSKVIVSIVLGSCNRLSFLEKTIASVRNELATLKGKSEIIVVDGGSTDGSLDWLCQQKDILTIVQHNRGSWRGKLIERRSWGYFMNLAFKAAQGKYLCMISDDCLIIPGAIQNGINEFEKFQKNNEKIAGIAFHFRNWGIDRNYYVQTTLGDKLFINHGLFLTKAVSQVGYIDEASYHFYCADGDLCLRLWKEGYQIVPAKNSYIEHFPHANTNIRSTNAVNKELDKQAYLRRWKGTYYDPKKPYLGTRLEKAYTDSQKTYKKFGVFAYYKVKFHDLYSKIKSHN